MEGGRDAYKRPLRRRWRELQEATEVEGCFVLEICLCGGGGALSLGSKSE